MIRLEFLPEKELVVNLKRHETKVVNVGNVQIGGKNQISVQSMLNVPSTDVIGNVKQALNLQESGCEIIRVAVPDMNAVRVVAALKEKVSVPVVADIHFDYKLALASVDAGIDKIRINPGNIGDRHKVKLVADACNKKGIPIRVGVNSGSLEREILKKYGHPTAEALCESVLYHVDLLEQCDFTNIVISMKSSDVSTMVDAYHLAAQKCNYPLHLGVTEAGSERMGIIKSACGIGALLLQGIGDTIRVSLTADPVREVDVGFDILKSLVFRKRGIRIVSCPTCGRTRIDLLNLVTQAENRLGNIDKDITVAIMGCAVNGPGEAREADIGIAGGKGEGLIFKHGQILRKVPEDRLLEELILEVEKI